MGATVSTAGVRATRVAAAGGLVLLFAACGGGSTEDVADPTSSPASPQSSGGPTAAGIPVTVTETEFAIEVPQMSFSPGTYTFTVVDEGRATHALEIDGPGVEDASSSRVNGGQSTSLTVPLQKGTYRLYCPIGKHASLGMDTTITVT